MNKKVALLAFICVSVSYALPSAGAGSTSQIRDDSQVRTTTPNPDRFDSGDEETPDPDRFDSGDEEDNTTYTGGDSEPTYVGGTAESDTTYTGGVAENDRAYTGGDSEPTYTGGNAANEPTSRRTETEQDNQRGRDQVTSANPTATDGGITIQLDDPLRLSNFIIGVIALLFGNGLLQKYRSS